ncbi:MAG: hypothetical protein IBX64_09055 [Actinobacteria bacterium]|nr:hypothetical protein [Actinomycetota bacterium]
MKKVLLWGGIGFAALIVIGLLIPSEDTKTTETTNTPAAEAPAEIPATTTTTQAKPKEWVKVFEFSGKGKKRSDLFELTGGRAKLSYNITGSSAMCYVYILDEGDSLEASGGFPELSISEAGSDSTFLTKKAGKYYLDVNSGNCSWTLTVEEER